MWKPRELNDRNSENVREPTQSTVKAPGEDTLTTLGPAVNPGGLIEVFEIRHPLVPASLDGFTILHISDLHIRAGQAALERWSQLEKEISTSPVDLVALTGDYANDPGGDDDAMTVLSRLSRAWRARFGAFGVFGNHDSAHLVDRATALPGIHWMGEEAVPLPGIVVGGGHYPEDAAAIGIAASGATQAANGASGAPFVLGLVHYPTEGIPLAAFGVHLVLAGHTHGGQVRMSASWAPHISSDLPRSMPSGLLRFGETLIAISRGLGDAVVPLRVNCARHAPLYVLRRGDLAQDSTGGLSTAMVW